MSPRRFQFTIGQIMGLVALLAVPMAVGGPRFAPAFLAIALVPAGIFVAARRRWGVAGSRIAAWLLVAYPVALLKAHYSSWAIVRGMLGHRPGSAPGDRLLTLGFPVVDLELIAVLLLVAGVPAALLCVGFVLAEVVGARDAPAGRVPAELVMSAVASWFFLFLFLSTNPGRSFAWFWD